jgi:hypothetical protein
MVLLNFVELPDMHSGRERNSVYSNAKMQALVRQLHRLVFMFSNGDYYSKSIKVFAKGH